LVLLPQVQIFALELVDLRLDLVDHLVLLVHLHHRLVSNVHRASRVVEGREGLVEVQS
jgi:hypothetical protein